MEYRSIPGKYLSNLGFMVVPAVVDPVHRLKLWPTVTHGIVHFQLSPPSTCPSISRHSLRTSTGQRLPQKGNMKNFTT